MGNFHYFGYHGDELSMAYSVSLSRHRKRNFPPTQEMIDAAEKRQEESERKEAEKKKAKEAKAVLVFGSWGILANYSLLKLPVFWLLIVL